MNIQTLKFFILFSLLLSCSNPQAIEADTPIDNIVEFVSVPEPTDSTSIENALEVSDSLIEFTFEENRLELQFVTFELAVDSIDIWSDEVDLNKQNSDTIIVYLDLSSSIEGKKIRIKQLLDGGIRVFQSYETSITIMNEGPHCDMIEWKHYNSDWTEIEILNDTIETNSYSEEERNQFIDVDMSELIKAVEIHCGERWADHVKEVKSPNEYPLGIGMNRVYFKIEYLNDTTGTVSSKIIVFEIPMGC